MNTKWVTRKSLLLRAKNPDDHKAWEEFVNYYKTFIHTALVRLNFNYSDFDDIEQEVLLKIWKNVSLFEVNQKKAQFRTWLSTLIRNSVIDYIRKNKRYESRRNTAIAQHTDKVDIASQHEFERIIEEEWIKHLTTTAFSNVKKLFSGVAFEAFELSLEGKDAHQISTQLGIAYHSVRTLQKRVKLRLIEEIDHLRNELEL